LLDFARNECDVELMGAVFVFALLAVVTFAVTLETFTWVAGRWFILYIWLHQNYHISWELLHSPIFAVALFLSLIQLSVRFRDALVICIFAAYPFAYLCSIVPNLITVVFVISSLAHLMHL